MDAEKLLQALTTEETQEVAAVLPADVFEAEALRRGFELPLAAGAVAVEGASQAVEDESTPEDSTFTPETRESLAEKLGFAFTGYTEVVSGINTGRAKRNKIELGTEKQLHTEYGEWITDDRLDYINARLESDPELSASLVATANETATADEVTDGLTRFGEGQPYKTEVWSPILKRYTAEEVSGTNPSNGKKFQFKVIFSKPDPAMYGPVDHQVTTLTEKQADNPFLAATSPLEDLTYLHTLRAANGGTLSGKGTFEATYLRSYKLDPKRIVGWSRVPSLNVRDDGRLDVDFSRAEYDYFGRVSVG